MEKSNSGIFIDELPHGASKFLSYVTQQHKIRDSKSGMTIGWSIFGNQVDEAVRKNIVEQLEPLGQNDRKQNYLLGKIPNLHSLVPYSLNAHKPVYKCSSSDGLKGSHISKARNSKQLYQDIINEIQSIL